MEKATISTGSLELPKGGRTLTLRSFEKVLSTRKEGEKINLSSVGK